MRLTDLNPQWLGAGGEGIYNADGTPATPREGVALLFDCPCGKCGMPCCIHVDPPLDGGAEISGHAWTRTGDTFDTLTLKPSIYRNEAKGGCGWHGFITNGEVHT